MAKQRRWRRRREVRARLELGGERPSPLAYREQVEFLDRIQIGTTVGPHGLTTHVDIQVKGRLHRVAEYFLLCLCAAFIAVVVAVVAHLAGAGPSLVLLASAAGAVVTCAAGRWYVSRPATHPHRHPER